MAGIAPDSDMLQIYFRPMANLWQEARISTGDPSANALEVSFTVHTSVHAR
jgi:hypothetical protein